LHASDFDASAVAHTAFAQPIVDQYNPNLIQYNPSEHDFSFTRTKDTRIYKYIIVHYAVAYKMYNTAEISHTRECVCVRVVSALILRDSRRRLRDDCLAYDIIIICRRTWGSSSSSSRGEKFRCRYYHYCCKSNSDKSRILRELIKGPANSRHRDLAQRSVRATQHFMQGTPIIETFHAVCLCRYAEI